MSAALLPDEIWRMIEPRLPARRERTRGGRPAISDRQVLAGIIFVLKSGIAWGDLPIELGCGCGLTCLRRIRDWQIAGVWPEVRQILAANLRNSDRIDWSRVMADSPFLPTGRNDAGGDGTQHGGGAQA